MQQIIRDFEESNFWKFIGLELEKVEAGSVTLKLPIKSSFMNVRESVHGGIYATILDTAMGFSARSLGFDEVITLEMNVHFLKAVREGTVYAIGNTIHQNRSTALMEAVLVDENDNQLAHSTGTFRVVKTDSSWS
ncbi:PaaI family thioesterase [Oceanobacillus luteolus]|uniref:PaaI family thioesterase n=1 Tax=Oceanobacillus luteolus TaxID=1274358 RepID=UPI00203B2923|nr:PaaI family thioesterase [Oceanobacillus luteolus]MCM3740931.1 PaaI family thioesterase [Oceanobacillus luteolus]